MEDRKENMKHKLTKEERHARFMRTTGKRLSTARLVVHAFDDQPDLVNARYGAQYELGFVVRDIMEAVVHGEIEWEEFKDFELTAYDYAAYDTFCLINMRLRELS